MTSVGNGSSRGIKKLEGWVGCLGEDMAKCLEYLVIPPIGQDF